VVVAGRIPQHRACRLGARRTGVGGVESCRVGAVGGGAGRTGPRIGRGSRLGTVGDHVVTNELPLGQGVHHPTFGAGPRCSQPAVEAHLPVRIGLVRSGIVMKHADELRDGKGGFHRVGHDGSRRS
jgi:hypothetical protein